MVDYLSPMEVTIYELEQETNYALRANHRPQEENHSVCHDMTRYNKERNGISVSKSKEVADCFHRSSSEA